MKIVSILPQNASDLERDLELALARIELIEIPISTLWDPWNCLIEVLPFLAWALSVDLWRSDWPEDVKRRVVANSMHVHSTKGTRPAVERALLDLGISAELVEWFQKTPKGPRGTFEVTAWANENITPSKDAILNPEMYDQIRAAITNSKNTRSHFKFKVGAKFGVNRVGVASSLSGMSISRKTANASQETVSNKSGVGVASSVSGLSLSRSVYKPKIDAAPRHPRLAVAGLLGCYSVIKCKMEAK